MSVQFAHHVLTNVGLGYVTYNSAVSTTPLYEKGLNCMTDIRGILQPYPGFNTALETTPTAFSAIRRIYGWRSSTGKYIIMISDLDSGIAKVYKYEIGTDTSASLIFTSTSAESFDFIAMEGQGWCYFGNGTDMKKYDGTTLKMWGLPAPTLAPVITLGSAATLTIAASGAVRALNVSTITTTGAHGLSVGQKIVIAGVTDTTFNGSFTIVSVPSTTSFTVANTGTNGTSGSGSVVVSSILGTIASVVRATNVVTLTTSLAHGVSAGMSITVSNVTDATFNGTFTVISVTSPTELTYAQVVANASSSGGSVYVQTLTCNAGGYFYYMTAYDSAVGHESSVSPLSPCTGNIQAKQITITWTPSDIYTDADKVRIYRTTDGGGTDPQEMALVATVDKTQGSYLDTTQDANLNAVTFAPELYRNDPPPPANGFATFGGRIYSFLGNAMYYTGREEISNGVQFECVPGATNFGNKVSDGNREYFDSTITAVAPRATGIAVFTRRKIWAWDGSTLDTMYPYLLLDRRGAISRPTVLGIGNSVQWLDTASQDWMDGAEISVDIRPDLQHINHTYASSTVHISGPYHWHILCDGAQGLLFTYDLDSKQWFVPRDCGATFVWSGNTSDSTVDLLIARNGTKILKMTPTSNKDDGSDYAAYVTTNLSDLTPPQDPTEAGDPAHFSVETNAIVPDKCSIMIDDDPDLATYNQLTNSQAAPNRRQGTYLRETWFMAHPDPFAFRGRRVSYRLDWNKCSNNWKLYSVDPAFYPMVGQ